uniref:Uncharacterized protein n=1 Tax=Wolfiporia cocos TaxID=81056 RepID=A0A7G7YDV4_9APHY|nr:hypothetical protein [Wolfiporia cocos]
MVSVRTIQRKSSWDKGTIDKRAAKSVQCDQFLYGSPPRLRTQRGGCVFRAEGERDIKYKQTKGWIQDLLGRVSKPPFFHLVRSEQQEQRTKPKSHLVWWSI